jgi:hypothetical protein
VSSATGVAFQESPGGRLSGGGAGPVVPQQRVLPCGAGDASKFCYPWAAS